MLHGGRITKQKIENRMAAFLPPFFAFLSSLFFRAVLRSQQIWPRYSEIWHKFPLRNSHSWAAPSIISVSYQIDIFAKTDVFSLTCYYPQLFIHFFTHSIQHTWLLVQCLSLQFSLVSYNLFFSSLFFSFSFKMTIFILILLRKK